MRGPARPGRRAALAVGILAALVAATGPRPPRSSDVRAATPLLRLLGPLADLGADVEWIRTQRAIRRGRHQNALAHAERALALAPERTAGWRLLAGHLGLYLASSEREPSPDRRAAWVRAALSVLERGRRSCARPGELSLLEGLILLSHGEAGPGSRPDLPWPGGERGLWRAIEEAGRRAAAEGLPEGLDLAAYARAAAEG